MGKVAAGLECKAPGGYILMQGHLAVINSALNLAVVLSCICRCAIKGLLPWTAVFHIDSWDCTSPVPWFGSLDAVSLCDLTL